MIQSNARGALRSAAVALLFLGLAVSSSAGDAFVRGGVIFHPRDFEFAGRWRADFGSDYAVNFSQTIYVGFEFQSSAFRQDVAGSERTATLVPINGFVNVKYKSGSIGARPYGGGGIGLISTFVLLAGDNNWNNSMGFHLLGGVELGALSLEVQLQRAFESGSGTTYAFYAGFVF